MSEEFFIQLFNVLNTFTVAASLAAGQGVAGISGTQQLGVACIASGPKPLHNTSSELIQCSLQ